MIEMRPGFAFTEALLLAVLLGSSDQSRAFLLHPGNSSPSARPCSTYSSGLAQKRSRTGQQHQPHQQLQTAQQQLDWRYRSGRNLRHVLFLEP